MTNTLSAARPAVVRRSSTIRALERNSMNRYLLSILLATAVFAYLTFPLQAQQISPTPNTGTITVDTSGAFNNLNPFDNNSLGILNISSAGTLTNNYSAVLNNNSGGTLSNSGTLNSFGTINNSATLRSDGNSTLNNSGTLNNNSGASLNSLGLLNILRHTEQQLRRLADHPSDG